MNYGANIPKLINRAHQSFPHNAEDISSKDNILIANIIGITSSLFFILLLYFAMQNPNKLNYEYQIKNKLVRFIFDI